MSLSVQNYPGGLPFHQQVNIRTAGPNATTKTIPMTHDGLAAQAEVEYVTMVDPGNATTFNITANPEAKTFPAAAVGMWLEVVRGTKNHLGAVGERNMWRKVITRTSGVIIVTDAFTADVEAGDTFKLHRLQRWVHNAEIWVSGTNPAMHIDFFGTARRDADGAPISGKITGTEILRVESRDGFNNIHLAASTDESGNYINIIGW